MLLKILASGSTGNSTFIKFKEKNILIDLGITNKKIKDTLAKIDVKLEDIDYVFLTHEHIDHIAGLPVFVKNSRALIYLTIGTFNYLIKHPKTSEIVSKFNDRFIILKHENYAYNAIYFSSLKVEPLQTFHDANEPVGYRFTEDDKSIVYLTDTGYVSKETLNKIKGATCYIFETNHDPEVLMNSERPFVLKQRILGDNGHLSNADGFYYLANSVNENTKYVFCAHISLECNLLELILLTRNKIFNKMGIDYSTIKFYFTKPYDIDEVEI